MTDSRFFCTISMRGVAKNPQHAYCRGRLLYCEFEHNRRRWARAIVERLFTRVLRLLNSNNDSNMWCWDGAIVEKGWPPFWPAQLELPAQHGHGHSLHPILTITRSADERLEFGRLLSQREIRPIDSTVRLLFTLAITSQQLSALITADIYTVPF